MQQSTALHQLCSWTTERQVAAAVAAVAASVTVAAVATLAIVTAQPPPFAVVLGHGEEVLEDGSHALPQLGGEGVENEVRVRLADRPNLRNHVQR